VRGVGVSPRDGTIVLCADRDGDEFHQLYLLDPDHGWPDELTNEPHGQHFVGTDAWSADGTQFAYAANARRPTDMECWGRDVEEVKGSADGRVLGWLVNEHGYDRLRLRDLESGRDLAQADLPDGARPHLTGAEPPLALSHDGSHAALIVSGPRRPPEAWVVDTASGRARPVTESRIGGLRDDDLVELELITFPTFDGRDIPAWLYRPRVDRN